MQSQTKLTLVSTCAITRRTEVGGAGRSHEHSAITRGWWGVNGWFAPPHRVTTYRGDSLLQQTGTDGSISTQRGCDEHDRSLRTHEIRVIRQIDSFQCQLT